jgi:hypothetical protein
MIISATAIRPAWLFAGSPGSPAAMDLSDGIIDLHCHPSLKVYLLGRKMWKHHHLKARLVDLAPRGAVKPSVNFLSKIDENYQKYENAKTRSKLVLERVSCLLGFGWFCQFKPFVARPGLAPACRPPLIRPALHYPSDLIRLAPDGIFSPVRSRERARFAAGQKNTPRFCEGSLVARPGF